MIKQWVNEIAEKTFGISIEDAKKQGICINCKEIALPKCYSTAGEKEWFISGLCELCFDEICGG